ncbi:hypothetical protein M231_01964 [Tremella mesenterica]|uniref:Uncharacterized protein n=1 Tax=Tremella mesenterica TaxID=5217 RepID=A0A4Q1BS12_TREME|nr:hypothetical protein M231_01964 [Tremella mesenterica]
MVALSSILALSALVSNARTHHTSQALTDHTASMTELDAEAAQDLSQPEKRAWTGDCTLYFNENWVVEVQVNRTEQTDAGGVVSTTNVVLSTLKTVPAYAPPASVIGFPPCIVYSSWRSDTETKAFFVSSVSQTKGGVMVLETRWLGRRLGRTRWMSRGNLGALVLMGRVSSAIDVAKE